MPTQKQINKLARDIVNAWDLDNVVEYAIDQHEKWLCDMPDGEFAEEWETFYDEPFVEE